MKHMRLLLLIGTAMLLSVGLLGCGSDDPTPTVAKAIPTATAAAIATPTPSNSGSSKSPAPVPTATPRPVAKEPTPTPARDMAAYFGGKKITIVVGTEAAGGYDLMARFFSKFAPKHFPGNPRFVVQNISGAGGLRGFQTMVKRDPNGLHALTMTSGLIKSELVGIDVPDLDLNTINWVGSPTWVEDDYSICADRLVVKSWAEALARKEPLTMAATSPGGRVPLGAHFVELAGGPIKMVFGYSGSSSTLAALQRGETSASTCIQRRDPKLFPELVENNRWVPLFWWNKKPDQAYLDQLGGPDPYYIFDLPGMNYTDAQKHMFETVVKLDKYLRMYVLHPDTPADIVAVWRQAFADTINDPEMIEAAQVGGYYTGLGDPEAFVDLFPTIRNLPPESIKMLQTLLGKS